MEPALLAAASISAGYDVRPIISGVSLTAQAGEFIGLIGPNGSGKSTLIRVLSRVLAPQVGTVTIEGHDIWQMRAPAVAKKIAVVPQDSPVAFDFSVLELVLMGRSPHLGRFTVEKNLDLDIAWECLRLTNLESLANRPATAISGGERQRASIARALAQEPCILLADEPIAHLDINHQIQILDLLQQLAHKKQMTVVAALHDLNLSAAYCDRLMLMVGGRLLADGSPADVITEDNIRRAYGIHAQVRRHPATGRPYITLMGRHSPAHATDSPTQAAPAAGRVHVICGAGTGTELLSELNAAGYEVSVGVVNVSDSDQQLAERLDLDRVEEAPFSAISEEAAQRNCEMACAADLVILCPIPFGEGNLANLACAKAALSAGRKVLLVNKPPIEERDFTGGKAISLFQQMVAEGALLVGNSLSIFEQLGK